MTRQERTSASEWAQFDRNFCHRYKVIAEIGAGAVGRVYEVEHVSIQRKFALKLLREEHRDSTDIVARFRREARIGGRLRSPYTVAVVDEGTCDSLPFFVMEYLEGMTLKELLLKEGALPVRRAARLILDACGGVRAAHAMGVIHRDLKPANLFACRELGGESCKVLDFGIAKLTADYEKSAVSSATLTGAMIGTLAYMPPEQIRGNRDVDELSDVYALGAIFYECLTGVRLFQAESPPALMYKILEEAPQRLEELRPGLPEQLVQIIDKAVAPRREERFESVLAFEQLIAPFAHDGIPSHLVMDSDAPTKPNPEVVAGVEPSPSREGSRWKKVPLMASGLSLLVGGVVGYNLKTEIPAAQRTKPSLGSVSARKEELAVGSSPVVIPPVEAPEPPRVIEPNRSPGPLPNEPTKRTVEKVGESVVAPGRSKRSRKSEDGPSALGFDRLNPYEEP